MKDPAKGEIYYMNEEEKKPESGQSDNLLDFDKPSAGKMFEISAAPSREKEDNKTESPAKESQEKKEKENDENVKVNEQKKTDAADNGQDAPKDDILPSYMSDPEYDPIIFQKSEDIAEGLNFSPAEEDLSEEISGEGDSSLAFYDLSIESEEKKKVKKKIKYKVVRERGGSVRSIAFTVSYIAFVLVCAVALGYFIIICMNDVFAFSKDDSEIPVTISSTNITVDQLADMLHEKGIIKYTFLFKLYVNVKYEDGITVKEGTFTLSPSFNYDKIINALNPRPKRTEITITFQEGITTDEIIDIFLSNGIGTKEGFEKAIAEGDFDYWFLSDLETTEDRYYRLDGYLYPDTYNFYSDSSEEEALKKLLKNFNKKFGDKYKQRIDELGLTVDQVVTFASMIEAEAYWVNDFPFVSAVFHNRLKSTTFNGKFDSDATIQYVLAHEFGGRHEQLSAEDLAIDSPYNTRLYEGFPPGPICNPSLNALKAAIYPDEDCGYYYFVADNEKYCRFAKTLAQHNSNIADIRKENEDN